MVVKIFTSEVGSNSGLDRLVKREISEITPPRSNIRTLCSPVMTIGRSSSRFIDNSEHIETGSSISSGLALGVVEVSGNGDNNSVGLRDLSV
jgi:hypothetical protein